QMDGALARVDELAGAPSVPHLANIAIVERSTVDSYLTNDAVRHWRRMWDLQLAAKWDELEAVAAADVVLDDRRRLVGSRAEGRDEVIEWMKGVGRVGMTAVDAVTLATRGEQLMLQREVYRGAIGEVEVLAICQYVPD